MNSELELIAMQLIVAAGNAKSSYMEAIQESKEGNEEVALYLITEGKKAALEGHAVHAKLIQLSGAENLPISLLLLHAEDQMMSCETILIVAEEIIALNKQNRNLMAYLEEKIQCKVKERY